MTQKGNQPAKEFRIGTTKAAIWRNEVERDGKTVIQHSIKLQRSYQDPKTGEWRSQEISFFPNQIPDARLVLCEARRYCMLRESDENSELPAVAR